MTFDHTIFTFKPTNLTFNPLWRYIPEFWFYFSSFQLFLPHNYEIWFYYDEIHLIIMTLYPTINWLPWKVFLKHIFLSTEVNTNHGFDSGGSWGVRDGGIDLLESEEERAGPDDEEQGQVEDSFLPGHHHPSVAAESVLSRELLPFSHLPCYHHRRHGACPVLRSALGASSG